MSWKMRLRFVTRFCLLVSNLKFNNNILNNGNSWKTRLVIIYYWNKRKVVENPARKPRDFV